MKKSRTIVGLYCRSAMMAQQENTKPRIDRSTAGVNSRRLFGEEEDRNNTIRPWQVMQRERYAKEDRLLRINKRTNDHKEEATAVGMN
jgi:hypothetical protein